jgi:nucleoside phosphorylase
LILLVAPVREELGQLPGEVLGIGTVPAAVRMAGIIHECRPSGVIMVGTGSAYAGGPAQGEAIKARRIGLASGAALMGLAYTPRPPAPVICDPRLVSRIELPEVDVLTTNSVTTDPVLAGRLADGWQVEHLEVFGVAYACAQAGVPFAAILGIASRVGPDAHTQWLTHRTAAQDAARGAVVQLFTDPDGD